MKLMLLAISFFIGATAWAAPRDAKTHQFKVVGVKVLVSKYEDVFGPMNVLPKMLVKLDNGTVASLTCSDGGINSMVFMQDKLAKSSEEFLARESYYRKGEHLLASQNMDIPECEQFSRRIRVGTQITVKIADYQKWGELSIVNRADQGADF